MLGCSSWARMARSERNRASAWASQTPAGSTLTAASFRKLASSRTAR